MTTGRTSVVLTVWPSPLMNCTRHGQLPRPSDASSGSEGLALCERRVRALRASFAFATARRLTRRSRRLQADYGRLIPSGDRPHWPTFGARDFWVDRSDDQDALAADGLSGPVASRSERRKRGGKHGWCIYVKPFIINNLRVLCGDRHIDVKIDPHRDSALLLQSVEAKEQESIGLTSCRRLSIQWL